MLTRSKTDYFEEYLLFQKYFGTNFIFDSQSRLKENVQVISYEIFINIELMSEEDLINVKHY